MAQGCPVISSNSTSLPEVGGEACLYFDPSDPEAGAIQLSKLMVDPHLWREMSENGVVRSECYSWEKHAEGCANVYKEVIRAKFG